MVSALSLRRGASGPFVDEEWGDVVAFTSRGTGAVEKTLFQRDQDVVWVTDFMTPAEQADAFNGTLLFDHQPAIQAAIDYALYRDALGDFSGGPRVRAPGGLMRLDSPINVGYGVDPRSIAFEGEGIRYGGTFFRAGSGTAFYVNFTNAPAVVVQGGHNVKLSGFSLFGQNTNFILALLATPQQTDLLVANWIAPGLASSRFAPYAGIAIDPYSGVRPGTSYPDVPYPAFLGATPQYGKGFSSNVEIEDVSIWGFVVGVVQQPCNADGNGDYTKLHRCTFFFCAYGYSWGNTQSRVPNLTDCTFDGVHTTLSTNVYGLQIGEPNIGVYSCSWSRVINVMQVPNLNFGQGPAFYSCFGEAMYSLGTVGQGAEHAGAVLFESCHWGFSFWDTYGVPTYVFSNAGLSLVTFRNVLFYTTTAGVWGALHFFSPTFNTNGENGRGWAFEGCTWVTPAPPTQRWAQCAYNATQGLSFVAAATYLESYSFRAPNVFNLDTGANLGSFLFDGWNEGPRSRCLPAYGRRAKGLSGNGDPGVPVAWITRGISANGAGGVVTQSGRNITFTFTGADADYLSWAGGDVGDVLICDQTGVVFWVYARTADVFSARAQNGFNAAGNLLTPVPNNATFSSINCRHYCVGPGAVLYGNTTAASGVAANVVDGNNAFPANIGAFVAVNDWIFANDDVARLVNQFGGNNRIGGFDNAAHTLTLLGNFERTESRLRLALFTRPGMANGTPTP